jgi:hypothetical protein
MIRLPTGRHGSNDRGRPFILLVDRHGCRGIYQAAGIRTDLLNTVDVVGERRHGEEWQSS